VAAASRSSVRRRRDASAKLHVRVRGTVNQISQGLPVPAGLPDASFASVGAEHTGRRPSLPLRVAMSAGFFHGIYGRAIRRRPPPRKDPPPPSLRVSSAQGSIYLRVLALTDAVKPVRAAPLLACLFDTRRARAMLLACLP
jgi:hypothetical protein